MSKDMENLINFVIKQLNIHFLSDVLRKWEQILDWFFYFNKTTGCGVPSVVDFRRLL